MTDTINTDVIKVTRDEAAELCIHHLRLAGLFFESGPDPLDHWFEELVRLGTRDSIKPDYIHPWIIGAEAFLKAIYQAHEAQKRNDP